MTMTPLSGATSRPARSLGVLAAALTALLLALFVPAAPPLVAQQTADVIRGRIIGPDSQPIANVQITAVSYFGGITRTARTNRDGRFTITYPNGEGDYWLSFAAIGYQAKRFEVRRRADEEVLLADTQLSNAQTLATVSVQASGPRQPPPRNDNVFATADAAGNDKSIAGAVIPPDLAGNLAAMASATPGIQLIPGLDGSPDRFSIFGQDPGANNATLNGQQSGLSSIPRDAGVSTQLRAGYDVANGGFSGGQIAVTQSSGNNYISRSGSGLFNAPQAQWNDRVGQTAEYSNVSLSGRASGPIVMDKDFYTFSWQLDRRSQNLPTLLASSPVIFQSAGISADSASRLRSILGTIGVPLAARGIANSAPRTSASTLGGFDWAPKSPTSGHAFNLSYNGSWSDAGPQSSQVSQTPGSLSESRNISGGLQLRHTNYLNTGLLTESMLSVSGSSNRTDPLLDLPSGNVLVTSTLDDGTATARSLSFGGGANANTSTSASIAGRNMLSWFSGNSKHRLKLITELRLDRSSSDRAFNLLGRYSYQSLADLEAGRPSSYSRQLNAVSQSGDALVGALAIGDAWRPTADVQVQYGLRLDANRFLTRPDVNPAVAAAFGTTNDDVPNRVYVSPRLGFSWLYGQAAQIPFGDGFASGPRATVRGGIGLFQNVRGPELASTAIGSTGLAGSAQQIVCTGDATPIVSWESLRAGSPTSCADGSAGTVFANSAPNVTLFAPGYVQDRSLRSNLSWSGAVVDNRFTLTANATYAYTFNQADQLDLNFAPTSKFALASEGGRPVYVSASSIDSRSGLIASRDARVNQSFNSVTQLRSDLGGQSRQVQFTLLPLTYMPTAFRWNLSYAYLNTSQEFRGFTSASGDPRDIANATGSGPRHDIGYTLVYNFRNAITFTWGGRFTSGSHYTPTIAGDINGDGRSNDRAFVFNPTSTDDPALAAAMQGLLANGSGSARDCLRGQIGRIASRNSCVGPWTAGNTTLRLAFNPTKIRLPQRTTLSFTVTNPVGAADLLLHGTDKLHGWGQTPFLDQSLLFVRGFDAAKQRFNYEVNQRFGSSRTSQSISRTPVTLTMQMSVDLAPTRDWQNLSQQLDRGRGRAGAKLTEPQVRQMSAQMFPNPMARMLQTSDQLHLSRKQADSLATMSRRYTRLVDSLWTPAAKELAALPKAYDRTLAQARLVTAREKAVGYLIEAAPSAKALLTKGQLRVLSSQIANLLEPRYLELLRIGQVGGEFGFFFF